MEKSIQNRFLTVFAAISEAVALITLSIGGCVLLGWVLNIPAMKSVLPGFVTMKANTALCFVLLGFSLWLLQTKRANKLMIAVAKACVSIVILVAGLTLAEYMFGLDFSIDQLLFKEGMNAVLTTHPGRMAINTTVELIILAAALFVLNIKSRRGYCPAQYLAFLSWVISIGALIG